MGRYADAADEGLGGGVPLGGFVEAFGPGADLARVGTSLRRSDYPALAAAFPYRSIVGQYHEMAVSTDSTYLHCVAYGAGVFVAGTAGGVQISRDGLAWTPHRTGMSEDHAVTAIAYGDGVFVAGNAAGEWARSTDGVRWELGGDSGMYPILGLAYGNGVFVSSQQNGSTTHVSRSTDGGETWSWCALPSGVLQFKPSGVSYGDGVFIVPLHNYVLRSDDFGETWREFASLGGATFDSAVGAAGIMIVGDYGVCLSADQGSTWERVVDLPFSTGTPARGIHADASGCVVVVGGDNTSGAKVVGSVDGGLTWSEKPSVQSADQLSAVTADDQGNLVMVGGWPAGRGAVSRAHVSMPQYLYLDGDLAEDRLVRIR